MWSWNVGSPDIHQTTAFNMELICTIPFVPHGGYSMIKEFPESFVIRDAAFLQTIHEPRSGLVSQVSDNPKSLSLCLNLALSLCFQDSRTCFFTVGNSPGYTTMLEKKVLLRVIHIIKKMMKANLQLKAKP